MVSAANPDPLHRSQRADEGNHLGESFFEISDIVPFIYIQYIIFPKNAMVGRGNCFVGYSEEGESVDEQIAGLAEDLQSTSQPLEQMTIKTFPKKTFPKKISQKRLSQKRLSRWKIQMCCSIHWG